MACSPRTIRKRRAKSSAQDRGQGGRVLFRRITFQGARLLRREEEVDELKGLLKRRCEDHDFARTTMS